MSLCKLWDSISEVLSTFNRTLFYSVQLENLYKLFQVQVLTFLVTVFVSPAMKLRKRDMGVVFPAVAAIVPYGNINICSSFAFTSFSQKVQVQILNQNQSGKHAHIGNIY